MLSIHIDSFEVIVKSEISVLEACKLVGITIPRFCYHELLSVSGNCRMCLVELENVEKPIASCVTEVEEDMLILTNTPFVKKARENVVEALLLNHPLDCPICDQAGECDLQDQTKNYGGNYSRFFHDKKSVEDKECGPLIKTIMTRCITCTRCVRYGSEIAGIDFFGTLNRGSSTEIGTYVSTFFHSEISGNVIDLCPVGALTSKPYAFKARPWELRLSESIDFTDSLGSNIYVNYKETEIFRILPKNNKNINTNIISDKIRFCYDANNTNRIFSLFQYDEKQKDYKKINWNSFLTNFDKEISKNKIEFVLDEKCDLETIFLLKKMMNLYPKKITISNSDNNLSTKNYFSNSQTNISKMIDETNDLILLLGCNLKLESPILNAKIRLKYNNNFLSIYSSGLNFKYNIDCHFINLNTDILIKTFEGKNNLLSLEIKNARNPLLIIGQNFIDRISNIESFQYQIKKIITHFTFLILTKKVNSEGINFLNVKKFSKRKEKEKINFLLNNDENIINKKRFNDISFNNKIWMNTHGSKEALNCKYIIPIVTPFEDENIYLNLEHKSQKTEVIFKPNHFLKKIKNIFLSFFPFDEIKKSSYSDYLIELSNNSQKNDFIESTYFLNKIEFQKYIFLTKISTYPIFQKNKNYYQTDTLTRNSSILKECLQENVKFHNNF